MQHPHFYNKKTLGQITIVTSWTYLYVEHS